LDASPTLLSILPVADKRTGLMRRVPMIEIPLLRYTLASADTQLQ
jgi:hypothetical protein